MTWRKRSGTRTSLPDLVRRADRSGDEGAALGDPSGGGRASHREGGTGSDCGAGSAGGAGGTDGISSRGPDGGSPAVEHGAGAGGSATQGEAAGASTNAGFTRSNETVSSLPLRETVTVLSERRNTRKGPSYGGVSGGRDASRRTKTCSQSCTARGTNTPVEDGDRGAVGRTRRMARRNWST